MYEILPVQISYQCPPVPIYPPCKRPLARRYLPILPRRDGERPILRQGEVGRPVVIPGKSLRPDSAVDIGRRVGRGQGVVDDVVLGAVRAGREAGVARAVDPGAGVLVEDAAGAVLPPGLVLHGVVADQLEQAEAVEGGIDPRGRVDDKLLARGPVDELLGPLVGGEAGVGPAVGDALPRLVGDRDHAPAGEGRVDRPRVAHVRDAEVGGPGGRALLPARVDVVELPGVGEVGPVYGELVVRVERRRRRLQGEVGRPGVRRAGALQDEHPVVDGRAVDGAGCVLQGRGVVGVRGG